MRLDGVRIGARDLDDALARYTTLLGVQPVALPTGRHRFQLGRGAIELGAGQPGVQAVVFAPEGDARWPREADAFHGLTVLVEPAPAVTSPPLAPDAVTAIDHVVVFTPNPERAIALWRDRLGLRLAFDRAFPERKLRLLFFRSGGLTFEFACPLSPTDEAGAPDRFYGVSYRVPDLAARRAALLAAGVDVSDIRPGNKPGTRVASVRSGTAEVPTLLLEAGEAGA